MDEVLAGSSLRWYETLAWLEGDADGASTVLRALTARLLDGGRAGPDHVRVEDDPGFLDRAPDAAGLDEAAAAAWFGRLRELLAAAANATSYKNARGGRAPYNLGAARRGARAALGVLSTPSPEMATYLRREARRNAAALQADET